MAEVFKMKLEDVMTELKGYGNDTTKRILMNHGAREPFYGVKIQDLKRL